MVPGPRRPGGAGLRSLTERHVTRAAASPAAAVSPPSGTVVAGNAAWNLLPFAWAFLLSLVTVRVAIRHLGIADYGMYGLLSVLVTPLGLANLGFAEATLKYVAEHVHRGEIDDAVAVLRTTLAMNLLVGAAGAVALVAGGPWMAARLFRLDAVDPAVVRGCFRWMAVGWVATQAGAVFMAVPPAMQRYRLVALGQGVALTLVAVAGLVPVVAGLGVVGFAAGTAIGGTLGCLVWIALARRLLPGRRLGPALDAAAWRRSARFGSWQVMAQVGGLTAHQAEKFLLGVYLPPSAAGLYQAAQTLQQRAYGAVFRMAEVLFPMFSARAGEAPERQADLLMRSSWLLTSLAVSILVPLVPLAEPILALWIGEAVAAEGRLVLRLLAVAGAIGAATNASFFFLLGTGRTPSVALLSLGTGVATVAVAALAVPRFGLPAAGAAGIAAMLVQQGLIALVILPSVFGAALHRRSAVASLYSPVVVGTAMALAALGLGVGGVRGLPAVAAAYVGIAMACGAAVLATGIALPGGAARRRDVGRLVRLVRSGRP